MTPDPSVLPLAVYVQGYGPSALDEGRLLIFAVVVGFFAAIVLLGAIAVSTGLRRS